MIIAIGREHGSGGHEIARALAEELGYACYDKEIVDHAAESSHFSREVMDSFDEKRVSPYVVPVPNFVGMGESFRLNMQVAAAQFEAIRSLAEKGNAIFVGRCADYVLRNRDDLLRIFIQAGEGRSFANPGAARRGECSACRRGNRYSRPAAGRRAPPCSGCACACSRACSGSAAP